MIALHCQCGFTELADETLTDHLLGVFAPQDAVGTDGQFHEEAARLACFCGFTARTPDDLDAHFLAAFRPDDAIGDDGQLHGEAKSVDSVE